MKGVLRDPAHASTRVVKRPWKATEALWEVFDNIVHKKRGSFVNLVLNSPNLQKKFNGWVKRCRESPVSGPRIKNLSYAKQRFNSTQQPLGSKHVFGG